MSDIYAQMDFYHDFLMMGAQLLEMEAGRLGPGDACGFFLSFRFGISSPSFNRIDRPEIIERSLEQRTHLNKVVEPA